MLRSLLLMAFLSIGAAATSQTSSLESNIKALREAHLYAEAIDQLSAVEDTSPTHPIALRLLGQMHASGEGVERSLSSAVRLYRQAATAGDAEAQYLMGLAYEEGQAVPASAQSAFMWYERAALRSPRAAWRYAEIVLANADRASLKPHHDPIGRLRYAAASGIANAQYLLGILLLRGEGVPEDHDQGVALLRTASEKVPEAATALATLKHQVGEYQAATPLFQQAFEHGDATAAAYLGHYAEHGIGRAPDRRKALELYRHAPDVAWAKEGARRLTEHFTSIRIFGIPMYGLGRAALRQAFQDLGIRRIGGEAHFDAFDVSRQMGQPDASMTVAYAPGSPEYIGEINYQIPGKSHKALRELFDQFQEALRDQYGNPERTERDYGDERAVWTLRDVRIQLHHDRDAKLVNVTYHLAPYAAALRRYVETRERNIEGTIEDAL